jgi:hypothetical protein
MPASIRAAKLEAIETLSNLIMDPLPQTEGRRRQGASPVRKPCKNLNPVEIYWAKHTWLGSGRKYGAARGHHLRENPPEQQPVPPLQMRQTPPPPFRGDGGASYHSQTELNGDYWLIAVTPRRFCE